MQFSTFAANLLFILCRIYAEVEVCFDWGAIAYVC